MGIIMDGNGRWASARGLGRYKGHEQGAKTLKNIIKALGERKIPFGTFFVFSSENWGRPAAEVKSLLGLLERYLRKDFAEARQNNVRLRFIGNFTQQSRLPASLIKLMQSIEHETAGNTGLTVNLCVDYGGRDDIVRATQAVLAAVQAGQVNPEEITADMFEKHTDLATCPPLDICIRTGGEKRLSNFVLWHLSYAELFFTDTHWPAFTQQELDAVLGDFTHRQRRFGKLPQNGVAVRS